MLGIPAGGFNRLSFCAIEPEKPSGKTSWKAPVSSASALPPQKTDCTVRAPMVVVLVSPCGVVVVFGLVVVCLCDCGACEPLWCGCGAWDCVCVVV